MIQAHENQTFRTDSSPLKNGLTLSGDKPFYGNYNALQAVRLLFQRAVTAGRRRLRPIFPGRKFRRSVEPTPEANDVLDKGRVVSRRSKNDALDSRSICSQSAISASRSASRTGDSLSTRLKPRCVITPTSSPVARATARFISKCVVRRQLSLRFSDN